MTDSPPTPAIRHYFVDEAGDPVLFSAKKKVIVGNPGCSGFFILGKVEIENPVELAYDLHTLRNQLLADPYFKNVPSMQLEQKKTALGFHAKDDLPEVRREVFRLLEGKPFRFFAVVRDKKVIAEKVVEHNRISISPQSTVRSLYQRSAQGTAAQRRQYQDFFCAARR